MKKEECKSGLTLPMQSKRTKMDRPQTKDREKKFILMQLDNTFFASDTREIGVLKVKLQTDFKTTTGQRSRSFEKGGMYFGKIVRQVRTTNIKFALNLPKIKGIGVEGIEKSVPFRGEWFTIVNDRNTADNINVVA